MRQVKEGAAKRFWHGAREQSIADDDCIGMCLQVSVEVLLAAEVQVAFPLECPVEREEAADRHSGRGQRGEALADGAAQAIGEDLLVHDEHLPGLPVSKQGRKTAQYSGERLVDKGGRQLCPDGDAPLALQAAGGLEPCWRDDEQLLEPRGLAEVIEPVEEADRSILPAEQGV